MKLEDKGKRTEHASKQRSNRSQAPRLFFLFFGFASRFTIEYLSSMPPPTCLPSWDHTHANFRQLSFFFLFKS